MLAIFRCSGSGTIFCLMRYSLVISDAATIASSFPMSFRSNFWMLGGAILTVTVHYSFFPLLIFFKICCFLHWIQSVNPHFLLPYIIMDLPIFVVAEWATLLVDIHCPRGGS